MLTSPTWAALPPDSAGALRGAGETLHWHAADLPAPGEGGEWLIERGPGVRARAARVPHARSADLHR